MKSKTARARGRSRRPLLRNITRRCAALVFTLLAASIIYSASIISPRTGLAAAAAPPAPALIPAISALTPTVEGRAARKSFAVGGDYFGALASHSLPLAYLFQAAPPPESVATYAPDCTTPKNSFNLGDDVCVGVVGVPLGAQRRVVLVDSTGNTHGIFDITSSSQTNLFTLPPAATATLSDLGTWRATIIDGDASARAGALLTVHKVGQQVADLTISKMQTSTGQAAAGSNISYLIYVWNGGPDAAQNVTFTDTTPEHTTFQSLTQPSGQGFTCTTPTVGSTGTTTCSKSSMAKGEAASFNLVYKIDSGVANDAELTSEVSVESDTTERRTEDNEATTGGVPEAAEPDDDCELDCPDDRTVTANATQNGVSGAFVTFSAAEPVGQCGAISTTRVSGSFFAVGTTVVSSTSETNGGSCSFSIIVVEGGGPTISCPANIEDVANDGCNATGINPGTPTASAGTTVTGERSDGESLSDPYPAGTTTITWRATDSVGRTATCTQIVKINPSAPDAAPPTITAPADLAFDTGADGGACGMLVPEAVLGTPESADDGCSVSVSRTGVPAGNFFPVGSTTVTWTATDASGNTATDTQIVTVTENTPPVIHAPDDASYTCPSEVPAGSPSQATGATFIDANGDEQIGPPSDNCGVPTVVVSETTSGAGSAASPLIITRTFTATDARGNSSSDVQTITVTDAAAPTITAPANVQAATDGTSCTATNVSLGTPTTGDNCSVASVTNDAPAAFPLGVTNVKWTVTDGAGNTSEATQTVTVTDQTPPTITAPANASYQCASEVPAASPSQATAADHCSVPTLSVSESNNGGAGTPASPLVITRTYTATDAAGNSASAAQTITVIDTTAPVMSCPANIVVYLPLNSAATSMAVSYPNATATDNCGGSLPVNYDKASGSVFNVGTTSVTASATDAAGNSASCTFTVTVLYNFTGFFSPVNNLPTLNNVNAGRSIPVKFSLSGNKGLGIMAAGYPASQQIACNTSAPLADLEGTESTGGSTLTYSPDQYHYNWKTESGWAGTCRVLVVKLNDGSEHTALFKFK